MSDLNIVVLYGGDGGEREVSLRSGEAVHRAILKSWDRTELVDMHGLRLPDNVRDDNTIIFPVLHGSFGEDGRLQDLLDKQGVIYAGSCARASRNCINKSTTKDLAVAAGLKVVPGFIYNSETVFALEKGRLFMKEWVCTIREEQVANPGDYIAMRAMGEPFIICRDNDGNINAFANVCACIDKTLFFMCMNTLLDCCCDCKF